MMYDVLLTDGTTGKIDDSTVDYALEDFIGNEITIKTYDENGNEIEVTGILESVL